MNFLPVALPHSPVSTSEYRLAFEEINGECPRTSVDAVRRKAWWKAWNKQRSSAIRAGMIVLRPSSFSRVASAKKIVKLENGKEFSSGFARRIFETFGGIDVLSRGMSEHGYTQSAPPGAAMWLVPAPILKPERVAVVKAMRADEKQAKIEKMRARLAALCQAPIIEDSVSEGKEPAAVVRVSVPVAEPLEAVAEKEPEKLKTRRAQVANKGR